MTSPTETEQQEDQSLIQIDAYGFKANIPAGSPPPEVENWADAKKQIGKALLRTIVGIASVPGEAIEAIRGVCRRITGKAPYDNQRRIEQAHDQTERILAQTPTTPTDDHQEAIERLSYIVSVLKAKGNDISLQIDDNSNIVIAIGNVTTNQTAIEQALLVFKNSQSIEAQINELDPINTIELSDQARSLLKQKYAEEQKKKKKEEDT